MKKVKVLSLLLAGVVSSGVLFSVQPVEVQALENENKIEQSVEEEMPEHLREQLNIATQEAELALNILENNDFTKNGEFEYMSSFISAAVSRVDGIVFNGYSNEETKKVYDALSKINRSYNCLVGRVQHSINVINEQFAYGSTEGKQIAVNQMETILNEETVCGDVNETTLNSYRKILDSKKLELQSIYAVNEADQVLRVLKEDDFTKQGTWEYMMSFMNSALDRARGLVFNGIDDENVAYVYDTLDTVNRSYNSIIGRINHAINNLHEQFNYGSEEGQNIALQQLEQIINEERQHEYVNSKTLESAEAILNSYK